MGQNPEEIWHNLPLESHRMGLIRLAKGCDSMCKMAMSEAQLGLAAQGYQESVT